MIKTCVISKSLFQVVLFCINEGSTYNISKYERRCPYRSEWIIKAAEKCGNVSMYNCVLDDNTNVYNEFCRKEPVLWQKGVENICIFCRIKVN